MTRLKIAAGWVGLVIAAVLVSLLVVNIQSTAEQRDRALALSEDTLEDLRRTRSEFREERRDLNQRIDRLLTEVQELTTRVNQLRRQVVDLGGDPFPHSESRPQPEPQTEQPEQGSGQSRGGSKGKGPDGEGPPGQQSNGGDDPLQDYVDELPDLTEPPDVDPL